MRIASMAYLPDRKDISSIKSQVDELHQYRGDNDLGDANKFKGVIGREGYLFTIDDDIIYPDDYIEYMIEKIEQYNRKAVITLHGKVLKSKITSFYRGRGEYDNYRCLEDVSEDVPVHIQGTGVMAWHSETIQFEMSDFPEKNMADIWAGIKCEKLGVPRLCVAHQAGWLKNVPSGRGCGRWNRARNRDNILTEAINSIQWRSL